MVWDVAAGGREAHGTQQERSSRSSRADSSPEEARRLVAVAHQATAFHCICARLSVQAQEACAITQYSSHAASCVGSYKQQLLLLQHCKVYRILEVCSRDHGDSEHDVMELQMKISGHGCIISGHGCIVSYKSDSCLQ